MASYNGVVGELGGAGKTTVTCVIAQYHLDKKIEFALFDADRSNPNVAKSYGGCKVGCNKVVFSENREHQDMPNEAYLSAIKLPTVINFPAQIVDSFEYWFNNNDMSSMAEEDDVQFNLFYVCNGTPASVQMLSEHFSRFGSKVNFVLVKNQATAPVRDRAKNWEDMEKNQYIQDCIKKYSVKVVNFPELFGDNIINAITTREETYGEIQKDEALSLFDRRRLRTFLKNAYEAFDTAEVFKYGESNEISSSEKNGNKGFAKAN